MLSDSHAALFKAHLLMCVWIRCSKQLLPTSTGPGDRFDDSAHALGIHVGPRGSRVWNPEHVLHICINTSAHVQVDVDVLVNLYVYVYANVHVYLYVYVDVDVY